MLDWKIKLLCYKHAIRLAFSHRNIHGIAVYCKNLEEERISALHTAFEIIRHTDEKYLELVKANLRNISFYDPRSCSIYVVYRTIGFALIPREELRNPLHLASLLVRLAGVCAYRLGARSPEADQKEIDFLLEISSKEATDHALKIAKTAVPGYSNGSE